MEKRSRKDIPPAMYKFRLYSGKVLVLYGANLFKLEDQLCQGAFTGDDFCDVSRRHINASRFIALQYCYTMSLRIFAMLVFATQL